MTTKITHKCGKCGRTYAVECKGLFCRFSHTADAWLDILSMFHALICHWRELTPKAHRRAPFYIIYIPLHFIVALALDILRLVLLLATWPFWWLHEEVL